MTEILTDAVAAEWRGTISATVKEHGRRLTNHDEDVRELRVLAGTQTLELARLSVSVEGLRGDISRALAEQSQSRINEFNELKDAVNENHLTSKERMTLIFIPIFVVIISSIVLLFATHAI